MKIPFCLPLIDKDVNQEVLSCLNETGWLTTGPKVKLLEDEITETVPNKFNDMCKFMDFWDAPFNKVVRSR